MQVGDFALVTARLGHVQQFLKTLVILILNFTGPMWLPMMQPHATYIHLFSFWIWIWPNFRVSPFHRRGTTVLGSWTIKRIFNQPQRPRRQERQTFTYLTMKKCSCARIARAGFIFVHFGPALVLPTAWDVSTRRQIFNFLFSPLSGSYQFNSRIISKHFAIQTTWNNQEWSQKHEVTFSGLAVVDVILVLDS